eukprot:5238252-Prorocentrum_lima.AAC.1
MARVKPWCGRMFSCSPALASTNETRRPAPAHSRHRTQVPENSSTRSKHCAGCFSLCNKCQNGRKPNRQP